MKSATKRPTKQEATVETRDTIYNLFKLITFFKATQCLDTADAEATGQKSDHLTLTNKGSIFMNEEIGNEPIQGFLSLRSFLYQKVGSNKCLIHNDLVR